MTYYILRFFSKIRTRVTAGTNKILIFLKLNIIIFRVMSSTAVVENTLVLVYFKLNL